MRTSVVLDSDVDAMIREASYRTARSQKAVINDAIRAGLNPKWAAGAAKRKPFTQRSFDMGAPLVDLTKANALASELEDAATIAKLAAGR